MSAPGAHSSKYGICWRQIQLLNLQQHTFVSVKTKSHQKISRPQWPFCSSNFYCILVLLVRFVKFIKHQHRRTMTMSYEKLSCRKLKYQLNNVIKVYRFLKKFITLEIFDEFQKWILTVKSQVSGADYMYFWLNWCYSQVASI